MTRRVGLSPTDHNRDFRTGWNGRNSRVAARDCGLPKSLAYLIEPGVLYLLRYARSIVSRMRLSVVGTATTGMSRSAIRIAPWASDKNARYQPFGLMLHERTNTRSFTTTTQMPMKQPNRERCRASSNAIRFHRQPGLGSSRRLLQLLETAARFRVLRLVKIARTG